MPPDEPFGSPLLPMSMTDGAIALRPFDERDLQLVEAASSDPFIPTISTVPATFTRAAGLDYIARQHQRLTDGQGWSLAIVDADSDVAVGQIGLWVSQLEQGRAELGYWVAPGRRRTGAASRALTLLSDWAFEHLDVDRLSLFIEPWNDGSIQTAERGGYTREGLLRGWERIGGEATDMVSFACLRRDRPI